MFRTKPSRTYLDWASAAPVAPTALQAFISAQVAFGNPGSPHADGVEAKGILEVARKAVAQEAGIKPEGVIFTSGATEANNLAIQGYLRSLLQGKTTADLHVLYLSSAHASTVEAVKAFAKAGVQTEAIALKGAGIDDEAFKKQIRDETALVVVEAVCGETGTRFETRNIRRTLDAARPDGNRIMLHVDASQLPFAESFEHTRLGADFITLDAQKVGGVRGIGALLIPKKVELRPLVFGGGQQQGIRSGTETPALAAAFAHALILARDERKKFAERASYLREQLVSRLSKEFPDMTVNGMNQVPHILNISFPGRDTDYLLMLLDKEGFSVATKSACEADAVGSRAVLAFTGDEQLAASTLRISWGILTAEKELARFAETLIRNVRFLDGTGM